MKKILITFLTIASLSSFAATDVIGEKILDLKNTNGQVMITIRKVEEKLGKPFEIEVRVQCGSGKKENWQTMEVKDSEAVCDVKPQSARLTADGKNLRILIRETDAESFNQASKAVSAKDLGEMRPVCKKEAKEFFFSVDEYCR